MYNRYIPTNQEKKTMKNTKNTPFLVETVDANYDINYIPFTSLLDAYKMVNQCLDSKYLDSVVVYKDVVLDKDGIEYGFTGTLLERYVLDKEADSYMIMSK
jgi:hypothetical protein